MTNGEDHFVYLSVRNFVSSVDELTFPDFKIFRIRQGTEAAKWKKDLGCKHVPEWILETVFKDYSYDHNDDSGFGNIGTTLRDLLFLFRLFKIGDLVFADYLVRNSRGDYSNLYSMDKKSEAKYDFEPPMIEHFQRFRSQVSEKPGFRNKFLKFSINHFMAGCDDGLNYIHNTDDKLVNFVIALESIFLIENKMYFLRSTMAKRICSLIGNPSFEKPLKEIYDERSNIVHGNNIDLSDDAYKRRRETLKENIPILEVSIREAFKKLFDHDFKTKAELSKFMESLYDPPPEAIRKLVDAKKEADEIVRTSRHG